MLHQSQNLDTLILSAVLYLQQQNQNRQNQGDDIGNNYRRRIYCKAVENPQQQSNTKSSIHTY